MANDIIAWSGGDQKWYLCEHLCNPEGAGPSYEITNGVTIDGYTFEITGPPGDQQVTISDLPDEYLRTRWTMLSGALYRVYQWSVTAAGAEETTAYQRGMTYLYSTETWYDGFWSVGQRITGSSPSYVLETLTELYTGVDPTPVVGNKPIIMSIYS